MADPLAEYLKPRPKRKHRRTAKGGIPQENPFIKLLQETYVDQIIPSKRTIVVLDDTNTVHEALRLLSKFKLLSAPVLDCATKRFLGFIDMLDIVGFVVSMWDDSIMDDPSLTYGKGMALLSHYVKDCIDMSKVNPMCDVKRNSPVFQCIGLFQKGVHRVAVSNDMDQIINVISQSDIIRFLIPKMEDFNDLFDQTVSELGLGKHAALTIRDTDPTIKALKLMHSQRISALAVVDEEGRLVGNFSASDLKGAVMTDDDMANDPFSSFMLPVMQFLKQGGMSYFPVVSCTLQTTLQHILLRLMALRVHRLWIVDDNHCPIGIVSLTDVMKAIIEQKQPDRVESY